MSGRQRVAFGLTTLTALVIGNMVGAGVFTTSGYTLASLGSPGRVLAAWVVGGVIALCGAVAYGGLVRQVTDSGGEYLFLSRIVHPAVGFVAGWVSLLAGFTGAIAFAALAFESYALPEGTRPDWLGAGWLASVAIVAAALVHGLRVRIGAWSQNVAVGIKLVLLLGFVLFAAFRMRAGVIEGGGPVGGIAPPGGLDAWMQFATALMWISLSYAGFNAAVYVAGESREAARTVPVALLLGTALVVVFYIALNAVFVYAPAPEQIAGQADVAAQAAQVLGGDVLALLARMTIALALLTSVSAMVVAGPRVYARMADDGLFPRVLRFSGEAPLAAIGLQAVLAVLIVWLADLRELLSYLGFTLSLTGALAVASLFVLHWRRSTEGMPVPLGQRWAAGVYVVATLGAAVLGAMIRPVECLVGVATMVSGLVVYGGCKWWKENHGTHRGTDHGIH